MRKSSSLARFVAFAIAIAGLMAFGACSSAEDGDRPGTGAAGRRPMGTSGAGGSNVITLDPGMSGAGTGGAPLYSALCGSVQCVPDDARSCADYIPPVEAEQSTDLAGAGAGGEGGAAAGAPGGAGGDSSAGSSSAGSPTVGGSGGFAGGLSPGAGASSGTPVGTGGADAGAGGSSSEPPQYACRVSRSGRSAVTDCELAGDGERGAPCFTSRDCGAGLACVSDGAVGRCRPFCCRGEVTCNAYPGTYCAVRELLEDPALPQPSQVPVCVTAENCDLSEPPCSASDGCECPRRTACQVVRSDGATACALEGSGSQGEPCPCRYGHVCSRASNLCLALCQTGAATGPACSRCQASAELPEGWGVCVE